MKKSLIASLIGMALLTGTSAYAVDIRQDNNGLDVQGNAIVSGDARVSQGLVVEGNSRFEQPVVFGSQNPETGEITSENYVTVVNGNVNASGNVCSGSGHSIEGNWAAIKDVDSRLSNVDGRLSGVEKRLSDVKKTSYRGIAAVTAIANIPTVEQGKRFAIGVGVGNFEGENALAIGASIRANESLTFKVSAGKSGDSAAYGAGAALSF